MRIGIDFDNTLAHFDQAFTRQAQEWGIIGAAESETKQGVRQRVRQQENGEHLWQRLQGAVYGLRMHEAEQFSGEDKFLRRCAAAPDVQVFIVSHKTERGHFDETGTNLRDAARQWMRNKGFFDPMKYAISEDHVFFESTQQEKVARIADLRCDVFIDDLPELFLASSFPSNTKRILFSKAEFCGDAARADCICSCWAEIEEVIFGS